MALFFFCNHWNRFHSSTNSNIAVIQFVFKMTIRIPKSQIFKICYYSITFVIKVVC